MTPSLSLDTVILEHGSHNHRDAGVCALEMVAFLAGEPHSDRPHCTSPVLAAFVRAWNDNLPDDETRTRLLKPFLLRLIGTVGSPAVEERRAYLALDWLIRVSTPAWLRLVNLDDEAAALERLSPVLDRAALLAAQPALTAATDRAAAAWAAVWAAARDAARDAARYAARAAARDAARDAAGAAARAAARAAAWAAARAAAGAALQPTVTALQASALDLLDQMIAVTETDVVGARQAAR
jgi:hypothetical protein